MMNFPRPYDPLASDPAFQMRSGAAQAQPQPGQPAPTTYAGRGRMPAPPPMADGGFPGPMGGPGAIPAAPTVYGGPPAMPGAVGEVPTAMSGRSFALGGYLGARDMVNGGGPGASGPSFSGSPVSFLANILGHPAGRPGGGGIMNLLSNVLSRGASAPLNATSPGSALDRPMFSPSNRVDNSFDTTGSLSRSLQGSQGPAPTVLSGLSPRPAAPSTSSGGASFG